MQSNEQRAYDRGTTIFSPDGRLYQVEYAREAVKRGGATVGVRTDDGVVFASNGPRRSSLLEPESIEKLHDVDGRIGMATTGHVADGRRLVDSGRRYAHQERLRYGEAPGVEPVAKAIADYIQESTQTGGTRPFGTALLVGGVDDDGPRLFEVDPSGTPAEWRAVAVGNQSRAVREFLEAEYEDGLTLDGGTTLALRALANSLDELDAVDVDVATMDASGFTSFDRDQRRAAFDAAGLGPAS